MDNKIYTRNRWRLPKFNSLKKQRSYKKLLKIVVIIFIAFNFAYFSIKAINPIVEKQCRNMAKSIATKISNTEATSVMSNYHYEDLLNIVKDEQGNIKMVETNVITINEIISDIPNRIQKELEKSENNIFNIPLGSFFGSNLFAGRGPNVNIKMEVIGNLDTNLKSEFIDAGINQTIHKIYLEVKCNTIILTPFETMEEQIINQVLLAEGVIVGAVPNSYYNLEGINSDNALEVIE